MEIVQMPVGQLVPVTPEAVRNSPEVQAYIRAADEAAIIKGYTEHGFRHSSLVSEIAYEVLMQLKVPPRRAELGAIAGTLHDIGNILGREAHSAHGGALAMGILQRMGMSADEIAVVLGAIANHDEREGQPVSDVSAALILADKSDVHRSRVRNRIPATFDIHDRVNHAARRSFVHVDTARHLIAYDLTIDTESLSGGVLDYFEIFLPRMIFARTAASFLGCKFELVINNTRVA